MVSVYPCAIHGARIKGPLEGLRVTVLQIGAKYSRYLRVCPVDLTEVLRAHSDEWHLVDDEGLASLEAVCAACGSEFTQARGRAQLFAYVWRRGSERADYFAEYCDADIQSLIDSFGLELEPGG